MAIYYANQKKYEIAVQMVNEALQLDSTNVQYLKTKAWLQFKLGKYSETVKSYKAVRELENTIEVLNNNSIYLYFNKSHA